jgi:site-specific DNA recombinase
MTSASIHSTRAAIYARVSSERQAQENTIASQIQSLRTRVAAEGLTLDDELCFTDDGYSGSTLVRPALERLRDQAAAGGIDRLYVHSPDRLARRYAYQALLVDELQHCGVELVFLNRPLGKGPEDDLLLQVQGIVAEYERAKILERSRRGKLHAARRGRVSVMAHAPYGYRYVSKGIAGGDARYEVCLAEAKVVQVMFRWVACERLSISQVARRLSEQNILSPRGRAMWDRSTVWGILRNPAYKGNAAYGKRQIVPRLPRQRAQRNGSEQPRRPVSWHRTGPEEWTSIPVPVVVEESLFESVQEQLRENKLRHRLSSEGAKYLLQGLVVCQGCGYAMCGFRNAGRVYYRCVGNIVHRLSKNRVCHNRSVRGDRLEAAIWADVSVLLSEPKRVAEEYDRRLNIGNDSREEPSRRKLQMQASRVRRQISTLIDAYSEGLIEKWEFEPRIRDARAYLEKLEAEMRSQDQLQARTLEMRDVIGQLEAFAGQIRGRLDTADWMLQRQLISTLVKRIEIGAEEVRVVYRVDCSPFDLPPSGGDVKDCWRRRGAPRAPTQGPRPEPEPSIPRLCALSTIAPQQLRDWRQCDKPSRHDAAKSGPRSRSPLNYADRTKFHITVNQDTSL